MSKIRLTESPGDGMQMTENHREALRWSGRGLESIRVTSKSAEGDVLSVDEYGPSEIWNSLTDAGANNLFNVYFGATQKNTNWYMGLIRGSSLSGGGTDPGAASTLSNIVELTSATCGGYSNTARKGPISWTVGSNRQAVTNNQIWTATGAWSIGATHLFLTDSPGLTTGGQANIVFNYLQLTALRQPQSNGDTITVSWTGSL